MKLFLRLISSNHVFFSCSVLIQTSCPAFCLQTCCLSTDSFHLLTRFIYHFRRFSIEISSISFLKEKRIEKKNAKIKEFLTFFFQTSYCFLFMKECPNIKFFVCAFLLKTDHFFNSKRNMETVVRRIVIKKNQV